MKGQPATADGNEAQRAAATGQDRENPGKEQRNSPGGLRLHEPKAWPPHWAKATSKYQPGASSLRQRTQLCESCEICQGRTPLCLQLILCLGHYLFILSQSKQWKLEASMQNVMAFRRWPLRHDSVARSLGTNPCPPPYLLACDLRKVIF